MFTKTTYKGIYNNTVGLWCGFKPEGLEVLEERAILYPDEGKTLQDKEGNTFSAVWLKDGKTINDFVETIDDFVEIELEKEVKEEGV